MSQRTLEQEAQYAARTGRADLSTRVALLSALAAYLKGSGR